MKTFKIGGVHPTPNKITADCPIIDMPLPSQVVLPLSQHIGAPAKPTVQRGDHVNRGDRVAEAGGFVSAHVHTPVSGTVVKIDKYKNPQGIPSDAIFIKADAEQPADPWTPRTDDEVAALTPKEIVDIVKDAGIVGMGGATFPTHVKLSPPPGSKGEVLIINAVECEPCLTCDDALMREHPDEIVQGVELLRRAANVERAVIAIENNKPKAIQAMRDATATNPHIEVMPLQVKYPQGGEKQLIQAVTGREVHGADLPISVGAIVQNVATAYAVYEAVRKRKPLIDRVMTVQGAEHEGNFRVAVGMLLSDVTGKLPDDTAKVIMGGPMMGRTAIMLESPVIKGTSGLLAWNNENRRALRDTPSPCIRCGNCVQACPMGLEPYLLSTLARLRMWDEAEAEQIANCISCGSCQYACPAKRPILDFIRVGKTTVAARIRARKQ